MSIMPIDVFDPCPARIAVFRALQLGDMLCSVPALRALRAAAPTAHITLIGLPNASQFAARFRHYIDDLLVFPGASGMPEQDPQPHLWPAFLKTARASRFDLAIQLHGSGELSNEIVQRLGARRCAGFLPAGSTVDTHNGWLPWQPRQSEILRNLSLMTFLGAQKADPALELPIDAAERHTWRKLALTENLAPGQFVCIHAGARMPSRRWPVQRFAAIALQLAQAGWRIVLTGAAEERDIAASLLRTLRESGHDPVDLVGATSLGTLAAMLSECRLVICNDTGVSHVAAAVRATSVVLACGSDAARWAPLDVARHRVLAYDIGCRPCAHVDCPIGHPCALGLTVEAVSAQVNLLLRGDVLDAA
jgi:ADP-heptose:LPS heptosyltransferase